MRYVIASTIALAAVVAVYAHHGRLEPPVQGPPAAVSAVQLEQSPLTAAADPQFRPAQQTQYEQRHLVFTAIGTAGPYLAETAIALHECHARRQKPRPRSAVAHLDPWRLGERRAVAVIHAAAQLS